MRTKAVHTIVSQDVQERNTIQDVWIIAFTTSVDLVVIEVEVWCGPGLPAWEWMSHILVFESFDQNR